MNNRWFCFLRHNPLSAKIMKNAFIIDISGYSNWLLSATTGLNSWINISIESLTLVEVDSTWKTIDIDSCIKIMLIQNFQKVVIKNDSSLLPERCFTATTGWVSFMRVTTSNLTLREKDSIQISVSCSLNQNQATPKNRTLFYWLMSIFNLIFLSNYRLKLFVKVSIKQLLLFENKIQKLFLVFLDLEMW